MPDFRALAQQAMTVEFNGETVALRPCPYDKRKEIHELVMSGVDSDSVQRVDNYARATGMALEATVVGADLTADEWLNIISADAAVPDLANLIAAAMRCTGFNAGVQQARDEVEAQDQNLGN